MRTFQKKIIIWLALILAAAGLAILATNYYRSFQRLQVSFAVPAAGLKASIYRLPVQDDDADFQAFIHKDYLVGETNQDTNLKLKEGKYLVVTSGNQDYAAQTEAVSLIDGPKTVTINPAYTTDKLAELLGRERDALRQTITTAFPIVTSGYEIGGGKLYEHGDWYGTTLRLSQTEEQKRLGYADTYRLVAHKENGLWVVKTKPPQLVLSRLSYPDIPVAILKDVNTL